MNSYHRPHMLSAILKLEILKKRLSVPWSSVTHTLVFHESQMLSMLFKMQRLSKKLIGTQSQYWEKINRLGTLFYRYTSDAIRPYTVLRDDGVAYTQPMNFGHAVTYSMEAIVTARPWRKYDFNFSLFLFQQEFEGTEVTKRSK